MLIFLQLNYRASLFIYSSEMFERYLNMHSASSSDIEGDEKRTVFALLQQFASMRCSMALLVLMSTESTCLRGYIRILISF